MPATVSGLVALGMLLITLSVGALGVVGVVAWQTFREWQDEGFERCDRDAVRGSPAWDACTDSYTGP